MSEYTRKFRLKSGKVVTRKFVVGDKPKAETPSGDSFEESGDTFDPADMIPPGDDNSEDE